MSKTGDANHFWVEKCLGPDMFSFSFGLFVLKYRLKKSCTKFFIFGSFLQRFANSYFKIFYLPVYKKIDPNEYKLKLKLQCIILLTNSELYFLPEGSNKKQTAINCRP